ncbi:uncharacterized protein LOC125247624 isoform X2 [Megalobrama amblycephala]|uniref:uncharacterized protein LOC125247624 isoform X2 n=1 Tax=Megalobrama amblycephala TaxID=75352 RepID=UPI00201419ED|nr:uncharacterized protein LOC125247624 isoform X2 [Megalobrama amblycephala]
MQANQDCPDRASAGDAADPKVHAQGRGGAPGSSEGLQGGSCKLSKQAIPELLATLESVPTAKNMWRFYGHFSAFLASIYGHRGGVYQNMTIQEVGGMRKSTSEKSYVINIESHETNQAYGPAQVVLLEEEYERARRFLVLRSKLSGGKDGHFFFTSTPNSCKNLNSYFQEAWKEMKLPGCLTFTD